MALLGQNISVNDLPESTGFEVIPAGWYEASINNAEVKETKDGTGQYIKVRYDITGPTHQGRCVFANVNIRNHSARAEEIGRAELGAIMRAIGITNLQDTDQLIGGRLSIKLKVRVEDKYGESNEVAGIRALAGAATPPPAFAAPKPAAPVAAPAAGSKAPWQR